MVVHPPRQLPMSHLQYCITVTGPNPLHLEDHLILVGRGNIYFSIALGLNCSLKIEMPANPKSIGFFKNLMGEHSVKGAASWLLRQLF